MNIEGLLAEWLDNNGHRIQGLNTDWLAVGESLSAFLYERQGLPFPAPCGCCEVVAVRLVPHSAGAGYNLDLAFIPRKIGATIQ